MKHIIFLLLITVLQLQAQTTKKFQTFFETGNGNQSSDYDTTIAYFKLLDQSFETVKMQKMGSTDSGQPLHIVIFNADKNFDFLNNRTNKTVLLINNGIHPGEPDGIDATQMLFRDLALQQIKIPKNVIVVAIPVYNIGGMLNRNATSRVNQDGPEAYGFRGNARNFDLNRDFIKADSKNAKSFMEIFQLTNPDVFIDNHVSNGADYQYVLTYIMTQHNKLGTVLGNYMNETMTPAIVQDLKIKKTESVPYVNNFSGTPDKGFAQFFESPRYSTGYASLFNTIGFVVETHMLKKYSDRVLVTYQFMESTINYMDKNGSQIRNSRLENKKQYAPKNKYPVQWRIDSTKVEKMEFLGYEGSIVKSKVTTGDRLFYDKSKPFTKVIPFYKNYKATKDVEIPTAYVIPQAFWNVIERLKLNKLHYRQLQKDSIIEVKSYKIADYKTGKNAYEGHYLHYDTKVTAETCKMLFEKGDYVFETNQAGVKYLVETLEPEAVDSFFNWNFFDTILQQKEGYSDYVFEDIADSLLQKNPKLKAMLSEKIQNDKIFAADAAAQLQWVYKNSVHYEKAHLQYPIYSY